MIRIVVEWQLFSQTAPGAYECPVGTNKRLISSSEAR
jgi:hypothetical protein